MVVNVAFGSHRSESAVAVTAQHVPIVTLVTVGRIVLSPHRCFEAEGLGVRCFVAEMSVDDNEAAADVNGCGSGGGLPVALGPIRYRMDRLPRNLQGSVG